MINWQEVEQRSRLVADVLVTSESGGPVAIIEVKNRPGLTSEIAGSIRRNLIVHDSVLPQVSYFLVVSDAIGWLWAQQVHPRPEDSPTAGFTMRPVVSHYASWLAPGERLSGGALEFVVANWLSDLSAGRGPALTEVTDPLSGTGFLESLRGAVVSINERL